MREKRQRERVKVTPPLLTYQAEEILVAKNRSASPLVLSFIYEPENIAMKDLGTLFGTFIVADHHEDSSYIVNCLAAAAKKEYFINPRRSVEESFESTLHKINLTLGKLVRDGHINWMGKFHGSIIAIRDREAYFSVTGEAVILLLRNTTLSAISEGLADPEAALHPLKTFTDISEGKLLSQDKIIVSTPELLELLPHALLEREAGKLPLDRFAQLMRTALINERSAAATILIDFSESSTEDPKGALHTTRIKDESEQTSSITPLIENIFSSTTFHKEQKIHPEEEVTTARTNTKEKERIDNRTGHIYIQADDTSLLGTTPETTIDRGINIIKEQIFILFIKCKKYAFKYATIVSEGALHFLSRFFQLLIRSSKNLTTFLYRHIQIAFHATVTILLSLFSKNTSLTNISFTKNNSQTPLQSPLPSPAPVSQTSFFDIRKQSLLNISSVSSLLSRPFSRLNTFAVTHYQRLHHAIISLWSHRSTRQRWLMEAIGSIVLIGMGFMIFSSSPKEIPKEEPVIATILEVEPTFPPTDEPLAREVSGNEILSFSADEASVRPLLLRDALFVITKHAIINGETKVSLPLPESVTPILLASAMRDLNAIFIYGADKKMYIFYPNAKSLVANTFPLPNDFTLSDMGTYLTYLYAFDAKQGRILRFPRAEGGFGAPTEWLKEKVTFDEHARMTIGESIFIGSNNTIFSFTKGRGGALTLSETKTPIDIQDIGLSTDGSFTILDTRAKKMIRFNKDGTLLGQYFSKQLGEANNLSLLTNGNTTFISKQDKILSFELQ
ncbi:MAG: hypothetical protein WAU28_01910 [Candidatus Moraniibacteriota bacterium]